MWEKITKNIPYTMDQVNDNENSFSLVNTITNSDVLYLDGTTKDASDINWDDVEIKSCVIEKFNALTTESKSISIELNFKNRRDIQFVCLF